MNYGILFIFIFVFSLFKNCIHTRNLIYCDWDIRVRSTFFFVLSVLFLFLSLLLLSLLLLLVSILLLLLLLLLLEFVVLLLLLLLIAPEYILSMQIKFVLNTLCSIISILAQDQCGLFK